MDKIKWSFHEITNWFVDPAELICYSIFPRIILKRDIFFSVGNGNERKYFSHNLVRIHYCIWVQNIQENFVKVRQTETGFRFWGPLLFAHLCPSKLRALLATRPFHSVSKNISWFSSCAWHCYLKSVNLQYNMLVR